MRNVVVVGGGLAGLAISGLLSQFGFAVRVVEARMTAAQQESDAFRSINLALSVRGIRTLDALGLTYEAMHSAVPMYGRRVHLADGSEDFQAYDLVGKKAIYSIRRSHLWQLLYGAAESNGADIRFDARCVNVDCDTHTITIADHAGRTTRLAYDALIGSDGAHSAVRRALVESGCAMEETYPMRHGYLELSMPRQCATRLERHALHIWPRDDHMLIALPNTDGSFTATLFLPLEDDRSKGLLQTRAALLPVFRQKFPDAVPLIHDLPAALVENPLGRLFASKCRPWSDGESVLLIGDAAHTMAPFYGQGMNCALEDCRVLMRSVERFIGDWPQIFTDFERSRRPDADAITILSEANYNEMSHNVAESDFKLRREIERELQMRFPATFVPLYAMITFSTLPYAEALARGAAQAEIVDQLATGLDPIAGLDLETEWLKTALGSAGDCPKETARSDYRVRATEQPQTQD
jgi:kynurenine 3-monooxygenase